MNTRVRASGGRLFDISNTIFLSLIILITLYPIYYVLVASISDPVSMMKHTGMLFWPKGFSLESYKHVFAYPMILGYTNTLFYVFVGTAVNVLLTTLAAYGLSRKNLMFSGYIMMIITFTMFFRGGLIPTYLLVERMGMVDNRWILIIWKAVQPWNLIIMRTGFAAIPDSLIESARIDGASHFKVLWKIAVPVSKAIIAVMILFYGVYHWNAWFYSMVFLRTRVLYPLQLVMREILVANDTRYMTESLLVWMISKLLQQP